MKPRVYRSDDEDTLGMLVTEGQFNWEDVIEMTQREDYEFGRNVEEAKKYKIQVASIKWEWESIECYCKHTFLDFPVSSKRVTRPKPGDETSSVEINLKYVDPNARSQGPSLVLSENDFRYAFSPDIRHMIAWSVNDISLNEYQEFVGEHFPRDQYDVIIFENPIATKSVKSVDHVQVLVREKMKKPIIA